MTKFFSGFIEFSLDPTGNTLWQWLADIGNMPGSPVFSAGPIGLSNPILYPIPVNTSFSMIVFTLRANLDAGVSITIELVKNGSIILASGTLNGPAAAGGTQSFGFGAIAVGAGSMIDVRIRTDTSTGPNSTNPMPISAAAG